jgi:molybdopterin-guanine dinucleotide biosynthesis protein A
MGSEFFVMLKKSVAVIVAGGKSSRMLKDKALLPFGDCSSLAEFQYKRLKQLFSEVYISSKENKFDFEVNIIKDVNKVSSPLVALISIFDTLDCDEIFILSVDSPFVSKEIILKLYESSTESADIIVAESKEGVEPLCAIYRRSFLAEAKRALTKEKHRLQSLFDDLKIRKVLIDNTDCFMNLNYPEEYEKAKLLIIGEG